MGHVSTCPFSREGASTHLPRRKRRRTREDRAVTLKQGVGSFGESFAARWLEGLGLEVILRNLVLASGEIDLVANDGEQRVAIEVRTITGSGDPIDAVDDAKRHRVGKLATLIGASRVDFVGVGIRPWGVEMHWLPG